MLPNRTYDSVQWRIHLQLELQVENGTSFRNGLTHPSHCHSAQSTFISQSKTASNQQTTEKKEAQDGSPLTTDVDKAFNGKDSLLWKASVGAWHLSRL